MKSAIGLFFALSTLVQPENSRAVYKVLEDWPDDAGPHELGTPPTTLNLTAEQAFEQVAGEYTPVKPQPATARQRAEVRMGARPNAS